MAFLGHVWILNGSKGKFSLDIHLFFHSSPKARGAQPGAGQHSTRRRGAKAVHQLGDCWSLKGGIAEGVAPGVSRRGSASLAFSPSGQIIERGVGGEGVKSGAKV